MADEQIIIEIKIDTDVRGIQDLTENIENLKKKQDQLNLDFSAGKKSLAEYNEETKKNSAQLKSNETALKNLNTVVISNENSINGLTQANKALIKERNNLDLSTEQGKNRLNEINIQLDINNRKIKDNVSGLEKQRLNIGNYQSALEGIVPGLGGMGQGISGITAGAKAFTATPFGATLQVIAGLLVILKDAFQGSEEGQRSLNKITQVTSALFGALGDTIRQIGGFLIDAFKNPKQTMIDLVDFLKNNLVNRFKAFGVIIEGIKNLDFKQVANGALQLGSGIENTIEKIEAMGKKVVDVANKALEQGGKVAELQAEIEDLEDEANLKRSQNDIKIAKLREDSIKQEGDAKKKSIEQSIALERENADFSLKIAQKKVELAREELSTATNKKEAQDKLEDAEVAFNQAKVERYKSTIEFEKQLESLNDAQVKLVEKQKDEQIKLAEEEKKRNEQREAEYQKWIKREEDLLQRDREAAVERRLLQNEQLANEAQTLDERYALLVRNEEISRDFQLRNNELTEQERQLIIEQSNAKIVSLNKQKNKEIKANEDSTNQQRASDEKALAALRKKVLFEGLDLIKGITKEGTAINKAATLAQIAYDTGEAISGLTAASNQNPANGPTFGAAGALQFVQGLIRIAANIAKAKQVLESGGSVGGGSVSSGGVRSGITATQATTNPINQSFASANAFRNMPPVIASWKEATEVRNRVEFKESLTTV